MKTREEALTYGLSFPDTYQDAPFRDANWQLVRVKKSKKVFLWTYEREGLLCLNVKVTPVDSETYAGMFPAAAKRPKNSRMSKDKLEANGFVRLPAWQDALSRYLVILGKKAE